MKLLKKEIIAIIFLSLIVLTLNYSWLDAKVEGFLTEGSSDFVKVERVIDGDTFVSNGTSIRLLGINSPEKGEKYYEEAKKFLEDIILNETVKLEYGKDKTDRYGRILAYVFLNNENINLKEVDEGFANYYFPSGKDIYYNDFKKSWEKCIDQNKNLCEKSKDICTKCIELKEWDIKKQEIIFYNSCSYSCNLNNWSIKDEGRKKFIFEDFILEPKKDVAITSKEFNKEYVWTQTGDTLFLRDNEGKLVLWESY